MALVTDSDDDSFFETLKNIFGEEAVTGTSRRDIIERNTNRLYLLFAANERKGKFVRSSTLAKNAERMSLQFDVNLGPDNIIDIITLTKSVDKVLFGKLFLCRVLVDAFQITAIAFVAEDPVGERAVRVVLYDFPHHFSVFKVGTFVAIANPYFKTTLDGGLILRCDKASEVLILNGDLLKAIFPDVKWKGLTNIKKTVKSSSKQPVKSSSEVAVKSSIEEVVKFSREEAVKYFSEEAVKSSCKEFVKSSSKQPVKSSSEVAVKSSIEEVVKFSREEAVKYFSEEAVKSSCKEFVKSSSENVQKKIAGFRNSDCYDNALEILFDKISKPQNLKENLEFYLRDGDFDFHCRPPKNK